MLLPFLHTTVHLAPSGADDDLFILKVAESLSALILTNDLFRDHIIGGTISREWVDARCMKFMFLGTKLFSLPPPTCMPATKTSIPLAVPPPLPPMASPTCWPAAAESAPVRMPLAQVAASQPVAGPTLSLQSTEATVSDSTPAVPTKPCCSVSQRRLPNRRQGKRPIGKDVPGRIVRQRQRSLRKQPRSTTV